MNRAVADGSKGARNAAFRAVLRDPALRRIQLADAGSVLGNWGFVVALGVYAYNAGGATLVGLATLARFAPPALTASLAGAMVARWTRRGVMVASDLVGAALLLGVAGLLAAGAPPVLVIGLVAVKSAIAAWFRPAKAALVPALARHPEELTSMNVVSGMIENVGMFGGPALGGLLLTVSSPQVVFAATGATLLWSAWQVRRIDFSERGERRPIDVRSLAGEMRDGLRAVAGSGRLRVMMALLALQTLVAGALSVMVVVVALDLLERGPGWVGYLEGSAGIGGIAGAMLASLLVGRSRLSGAFGLAMIAWGVPMALMALGEPAIALAMMFALGAANSVGDVAYLTLLQRAIPEDEIALVFGGLDAIVIGTMGLGGVVAAVVVDAAGAEAALVAFGTLLPLVTVAAWGPLRRIDQEPPPARVLELLRGLPIFAALPVPVLERLAFAARPLAVAPGELVFEQGQPGDDCFLIERGEVEVAVDGRVVRTQGAGALFGEIALLYDSPRTASVRALGATETWALDRREFLAALGASSDAARGAARVAAARLSYARPATVA